MKGQTKILQSTGTKKKVGVAILISDKIDFKQKQIRRDKEGYILLLIMRTTDSEDIVTLHIYTPNSSAHNFIQGILLKIKTD